METDKVNILNMRNINKEHKHLAINIWPNSFKKTSGVIPCCSCLSLTQTYNPIKIGCTCFRLLLHVLSIKWIS